MTNEELEKRVAKLEAKEKEGQRRNTSLKAISLAGAATGAGITYWLAGDTIKTTAEGFGELIHSVQKGAELATIPFRESELTNKYVVMLPQDVANVYRENLSNEKPLAEALHEIGTGGQRASLKLPAMESEPIKKIRDPKGKIIEWTKGLFAGDKEEAAIQNSELYQQNYNEIARLRLSTLAAREETREKMSELSQKLELSYLNTSHVDKGGLQTLEELARHYNSVSNLLNDINSLDIMQKKEGMLNEQYKTVMQQADNYGIKPYDASAWGNVGLGAALVLGAIAGYKLTKPLVKFGLGAYDMGKSVAGISVKGTKKIGKLFRKLKNERRESLK